MNSFLRYKFEVAVNDNTFSVNEQQKVSFLKSSLNPRVLRKVFNSDNYIIFKTNLRFRFHEQFNVP